MKKADLEDLKPFTHRQILSCLRTDSTLCEVFHENTKLTRTNAAAYVGVINAVLRQEQLVHVMKHADKIYSLVDETVTLPAAAPDNTLEDAIARRRSLRKYSGDPMTLAELSRLLRYTYGRTATAPAPKHFRAVPSGGALYPLEVYIASLHVDGCEPGLYHYQPKSHAVERIVTGDCRERLRDILFLEGIDFDNASAVIAFTAIMQRNLLKYQDRGYRMILLEAGGAAQNFSLMATTLGLGCVWLGGFYDDELCDFLGTDPVGEPVLLAGVIGRPGGR